MSAQDGGPAFPCEKEVVRIPSGAIDRTKYFGISTRDYFAAKALAGLLCSMALRTGSRRDLEIRITRRIATSMLSQSAYQMADAMLKARES